MKGKKDFIHEIIIKTPSIISNRTIYRVWYDYSLEIELVVRKSR